MARKHNSDALPDEDERFQREVSDVKRLQHNQAPPARPLVSPPSRAKDETVHDVEGSEVVEFRRPGIQTSVLRELRRGRFAVEATLDLHGLTSDQAETQIRRFVLASQARGLRTVRIIHGKGQRSAGQQPVLKPKVSAWLKSISAVLAFCSTRQRDGGTGAVDVRLRK